MRLVGADVRLQSRGGFSHRKTGKPYRETDKRTGRKEVSNVYIGLGTLLLIIILLIIFL